MTAKDTIRTRGADGLRGIRVIDPVGEPIPEVTIHGRIQTCLNMPVSLGTMSIRAGSEVFQSEGRCELNGNGEFTYRFEPGCEYEEDDGPVLCVYPYSNIYCDDCQEPGLEYFFDEFTDEPDEEADDGFP